MEYIRLTNIHTRPNGLVVGTWDDETWALRGLTLPDAEELNANDCFLYDDLRGQITID